jgi:hypothetical protein
VDGTDSLKISLLNFPFIYLRIGPEARVSVSEMLSLRTLVGKGI